MIIDHRVEPSPAIQNPMTKTIVRFPNNQTLFIRLIIRTFQLVFQPEQCFSLVTNQPTMFFSRLINTAERGKQ
jgi:hypothetical protein